MAAETAPPPAEALESPAAPVTATTTRDDLRDILAIALQGGQLLLENGAETWRVEETLQHLGVGLGAEWMDIYPTPTGIIISTVAANEHRTRIRRVTNLVWISAGWARCSTCRGGRTRAACPAMRLGWRWTASRTRRAPIPSG
jgi:hypothetical protein